MNKKNKPFQVGFTVIKGAFGTDIDVIRMKLEQLNDTCKFSRVGEGSFIAPFIYNDDLAALVKDFQKYCGLPQTGNYDPTTRQVLEQRYAAMMAQAKQKASRLADGSV